LGKIKFTVRNLLDIVKSIDQLTKSLKP